MAAATNAWLALCGVALSACVLVVPAPADDAKKTCSLTASERLTVCGPCVEEACQDALDDCCKAGSACEPAIANLVKCAIYETCEASGTSSEERDLRACAARSCLEECNLQEIDDVDDAGNPIADAGAKVCSESGETCSCEVKANAAASGVCKPFTLKNEWVCCKGDGYPTVGTTCACTPVQCTKFDGGCRCSAVVEHQDGSDYADSCYSSAGTCCQGDTTGCECDDSRDRCPSNTSEVVDCFASELSCSHSTKVDACTP
jgi:hypothetical protein